MGDDVIHRCPPDEPVPWTPSEEEEETEAEEGSGPTPSLPSISERRESSDSGIPEKVSSVLTYRRLSLATMAHFNEGYSLDHW